MKTYRKIDLFYCGDYVCSTMQSKTCREAKQNFIKAALFFSKSLCGKVSLIDRQVIKNPQHLKAYFAK